MDLFYNKSLKTAGQAFLFRQVYVDLLFLFLSMTLLRSLSAVEKRAQPFMDIINLVILLILLILLIFSHSALSYMIIFVYSRNKVDRQGLRSKSRLENLTSLNLFAFLQQRVHYTWSPTF